jgi:cephalosporin-C deacetylase-like acetyl esterase
MHTLLALLVVVVQGVALPQTADTAVKLTVTPDHADWRYHIGETARFTIALRKNGLPVQHTTAQVELAPERMKPLHTENLDVSAASRVVTGTLGAPGFLRATATATVDGVRYTQLATVAFDPERLVSPTPTPRDFVEFWTRTIEEARRVPLEPVLTRLPERSTPDVDVYHIRFQNFRAGSHIYGMLSIPTKPGKYPAMLVVPGAGVRPYFPDVRTAQRGVIHLAIGIHGIPVDRDSLLYNELRASALMDYRFAGMEGRDSYYYKRVYAAVVRAGDFLLGLPQWDGVHYAVQGGSQGGGLTLVAAALDTRVTAIAVSYPALADQFGYFIGRAGGWPHAFADTTTVRALAEKKETVAYYDAVNFARLVKVPGIYAWGFNDTTVPPTASYATYNAIVAPKETVIVPETGHNRVPAQIERMNAWLLAKLGVP